MHSYLTLTHLASLSLEIYGALGDLIEVALKIFNAEGLLVGPFQPAENWRFGADDREVGGFGAKEDLRRAYEKASGVWREDAFQWWTVARTLWWGLGLARQTQVFIEGGTTSIVLAASGRRVVELEYDLLRLMEDAI